MTKNSWYRVEAKAATSEVDVFIYTDIGYWGVTALDFVRSLRAVVTKDTKAINVRINSYGGEVFAALPIYNYLKALPNTVNVFVDGIAASAASIIAMAGDTIYMPANAFLMIHNPLIGLYGNAEELRKQADILDKIAESLASVYVESTGLDTDKVRELMDAETWLTAKEAVELGFADEVTEEFKAAAYIDLSGRFAKVPGDMPFADWVGEEFARENPTAPKEEGYVEVLPEPVQEAEVDELEHLCVKLGVPDKLEEFKAHKFSPEDAWDALAAEETTTVPAVQPELAAKSNPALGASRLANLGRVYGRRDKNGKLVK